MGCLNVLRKAAVVSLMFYACAIAWTLAFAMKVKGEKKK